MLSEVNSRCASSSPLSENASSTENRCGDLWGTVSAIVAWLRMAVPVGLQSGMLDGAIVRLESTAVGVMT